MADEREQGERVEAKPRGYAWRDRRATREELEALRGKSADEVNEYLEEHFLEGR